MQLTVVKSATPIILLLGIVRNTTGQCPIFQVTQMYRRVLLKLHLNTSYNQVHTLKEEKKTWKKTFQFI